MHITRSAKRMYSYHCIGFILCTYNIITKQNIDFWENEKPKLNHIKRGFILHLRKLIRIYLNMCKSESDNDAQKEKLKKKINATTTTMKLLIKNYSYSIE